MTERETMRVRLPIGLHAHLHEIADAQGMTLSTLVAMALAEWSRWSPRPDTPDSEPDSQATDDDEVLHRFWGEAGR